MRARILSAGLALTTLMLVSCSSGGLGSTTSSSTPTTPGASATSTGSPDDNTTASGVEGRTMVDGGCPVEIEGSPCPAKPISARVVAVDAGTGAVAASLTSGTDGWFRMTLAPGRYRLEAANLTGAAYPRSSPVEVVVERGRYTAVTVQFDSGIQ